MNINMSDSENYFSDSDKSENNDTLEPRDEEEVSEDEEYDEETRRIIFDTSRLQANSYDMSATTIVKKVKKKKKQKEKKHLSLFEYEQKIEEEKPKKWKGKRFADKRDKLGLGSKVKVKKRCFNPRLPPPTCETFKSKDKSEDKIDINSEMFPSLYTIEKKKEMKEVVV
tara:strand:- start:157 stop:663 length:507 start_codon:yes stop_codon:yes gene_type:complete